MSGGGKGTLGKDTSRNAAHQRFIHRFADPPARLRVALGDGWNERSHGRVARRTINVARLEGTAVSSSPIVAIPAATALQLGIPVR